VYEGSFLPTSSPTPVVSGVASDGYSNTSPIFEKGFSRQDLTNYLPGLAFNLDPSDLCLLSSWDYRREPPVPGFIYSFAI
jgi:hypothetical protein